MTHIDTPDSRTKVLAAIAALGTRRPIWVLAVVGALVVAAALLAPGIQISTSRYGLVSPDDPDQARLLRFFDRFGYPDAPILVVSGGSVAARRRLVDRLSAELERSPELHDRVLSRVGPEEIAEALFLRHPELLATLQRKTGKGADLGAVIVGGLPAWLGAIEERIRAGDGAAAASGEAVDRDLRRLADLVRALDDELAGRDGMARLAAATEATLKRSEAGLDSAGYLAGAGARHHLIALFPELPGVEGHQIKPIVDRIRAIRDDVLGEVDAQELTAHLTGLPALVTDELAAIQEGLRQSTVVAAIGILIVLLLGFGSLRYAILSLLPLGMAMVITIGAVRLIYGRLTLISAPFVSVLLGLGIDFAVHLLGRYSESRHGGVPSAEAIRLSLVRAGPAIVTGAVTTILAFLTTTTTRFTAFAELGVITSVGLVLMLGCTLLLMPSLVKLVKHGALPEAREIPGFRRLVPLVRRGRHAILAMAALATVTAAVAIPQLGFNSRYFDFIPARTESAIGLAQIEHDEVIGPIFASVSAVGVEEARAMAERLRDLPSVAGVEAATDFLPPVDEARLGRLQAALETLPEPFDLSSLRTRLTAASEVLPRVEALADSIDEVAFGFRQQGRSTEAVGEVKEALVALRRRLERLPDEGREAIGRLQRSTADVLERALTTARRVAKRGGYEPTDLPKLFRSRFVSHDGRALALYVYPSDDIWQPRVARRFSRDMKRIDPEAAGPAINVYRHQKMIIDGFERAAVYAALLVIAVLLLHFRSAGDAALALTPVAVGWVWMLGLMSLLGVDFNIANIVALPLLLGIGIDAGVHMMHRCRDSAAEHGGVATEDNLLRGTGRAVFLASVTTMTGFAALMVADYGAMKSLGLVMTIGMACCLAATLLVLPAVLFILGRAR